MLKRKINKNLTFLINTYNKGYRGAVQEGSSRSGKTFSDIDFVIYLCSVHDEPQVINIIKDTYNSFKTTLYDDFSKRLNDYNLHNPFEISKEVSSFKIFNHKINFLGADKPSKFHGASSDFNWYNESLDISNAVFDQSEMRCRKFWWMDYNPKVSLHYVYDKIIPRDDVRFLHSTFLDNPYISKAELNKILSYEPTHPEDRSLPEEERRQHPANIDQGTADDYMWGVYGLGKRMSRTGLVYPNVTWVDEFPDYERIGYGLDLGFTNSPSSLTKATVIGNKIYAECLIYTPTEHPKDLAVLLDALGLRDQAIWCDSAHPIFIAKLNQMGFKVFAIKKTPIMDGIGLVKMFDIHLIKNHHVQKEQENYSMREVNGIPLDEPVKAHDHFWDSLRYNVMANFRT